MTEHGDEAGIRKLEAQLWRPPPGVQAQGPWSAEAEMNAFRSLKSALGQ